MTALFPPKVCDSAFGGFVFLSYKGNFVKYMEKYFYSSSKINKFDQNNIKLNSLVRFACYDTDIPHFAKIGEGVINAIYPNSVDIVIDKNQIFFDASADGSGINLDHGLFLVSKYENSDIVIFNIPISYIWDITNEKNYI